MRIIAVIWNNFFIFAPVFNKKEMNKIIGLFLVSLFLVSCQQEKTAYVNNQKLQDNFDALKKTTERFEKKRQKLEARVQEEGQKFQDKVEEFQNKAATMGKANAEKRQKELVLEQQRLQNAFQQEDNKLREEMSNVQDSLEKVMKNEISKYAKAQNYTYIFGENADFNILYAENSKDITDEVIKSLNKKEE